MGVVRKFLRAGLFMLAGCLAGGCNSDRDGAVRNSNEDAPGSDADLAANGSIAERRDRVSWYLRGLEAATTVEEERDAVTELAQWLELDECAARIEFHIQGNEYSELDEHATRIDFDEWEGRDLLISVPFYPPVTPSLRHTFLEPAHMALLPLWDCSGLDSVPASPCVIVPASSGTRSPRG